MSDYYPPGHPSLTRRVTFIVDCEKCGHSFEAPGSIDASVDYCDTDEDPECPKCGHVDGDPVPNEEDEDDA